ncbi:Fibronectin-binding A domain protein [Sulfobacillus acidophilus TPY]|uniref:NFACT RNA-binding domain-containing protein n=1 Tax=Sulfobacillus acidophilus (strain ATCC 700253 / DSM 10332 / NAL) TaxID=679936 RepID=G8TX63_SULAD|nr:Fibronectin-binding A domain protein [Sulfobacillus acidophilus TPY]AEW04971.1 protein of unknown function DUF814 [Sulfobacillus acidophilus DSM 10332]
MPFDALVVRALEVLWQQELVGSRVVHAAANKDRVIWELHTPRGTEQVLVVLSPGIQRAHRIPVRRIGSSQGMPGWIKNLIPFTITQVTVPPWERVIRWDIERPDDWDRPQASRLIFELAGHLTNVIWVADDDRVLDAWRRVPPGQKGRAVWPGVPYTPPPAVPNPLETRRLPDLPPWARRWITDAGGNWDDLAKDWATGQWTPYLLTPPDKGVPEAWVYPMPGFHATPETRWEDLLDRVFRAKEDEQARVQLGNQLKSQWQRRLTHLESRLAEFQRILDESCEDYREAGDFWLLWLAEHPDEEAPLALDQPSWTRPGHLVRLTRSADQSPAEASQAAYRLYKKLKHRQEIVRHLEPQVRQERDQIRRQLEQLSVPHALEWYREHLKKTPVGATGGGAPGGPFREFKSLSGFPIWVGKTREDNAALTFKKARPDDIWFHTKQTPGSHVILATGKKNPNLEDLLDAAQLAVYFSAAKNSSSVPVDYTRRKWVRKRPHGEPGQVLYQREKTLYITPDPDRLKRLGAMREKLWEEQES